MQLRFNPPGTAARAEIESTSDNVATGRFGYAADSTGGVHLDVCHEGALKRLSEASNAESATQVS